jgi:MFS family permease
MIYRFLGLNPHDPTDRNAYLFVTELFWASILGSAATFNTAFALRLEATNAEIGWLTSLPALLAVLISIPAGSFLQSRSRRTPWVLWSLFLHRLGFLLMAAIPLLKGLHIPLGGLTVGILVAISIPAHFFNVGWIAMIGDVLPESKRATVVSARMMINNATLSVFNFLFGLWLANFPFPFNYTLMYLFGFTASVISSWYLLRMEVPDAQPVLAAPPASLGERLITLRQEIASQPGVARIIINTIFHGIGLWLAAPLYMLFYVRELGASEAWIGLQGTIATLAVISAVPFWQRQMSRWGRPKTLKRSIVLIGLFPIIVGLTGNLNLILLAIALNSLITPAVSLSHFTTLLDITPPADRPRYTSWYMSVVNIGAFVCPMIGVAISGVTGIRMALVVFGILSCVGSFSFWVWPVQK